MQTPPDGVRPDAPDPHGLDPQEVLARDPRVLLDPRFLGGLHAQLAKEHAPAEVCTRLLRMGFLHGLQDALHANARTAPLGDDPCYPPLLMQYRVVSRDSRIEVHGSWPERNEASARLAAAAREASGTCALSAGYTSGWLSGMLELDLLAVEQTCSAEGEPACRFLAREVSAWRREGGACEEQLDAIPFADYRALIRAREGARCLAGRASHDESRLVGIDRDSACVHIWGPVMVLPYGGADEGLLTLDLLGRDPEAQQVTVVVVHLGDAIIDPAFGALALELIVRTAESWGAETLFAEPNALSEAVLAELDHPPLLIVKELDQAIATAFQIAAAQGRSV
jgi:hypothetical protein